MRYDGYKDKYGMVTVNGVPKEPYADNSENGLLFTAQAIHALKEHKLQNEFLFEPLFNDCFIDGVLYRSAEPHPKPDSHDNYTGAVLASLIQGCDEPPRKLLKSLIKHFGVVKGEIFLRFPQVWLLLFSTCFPLLRPFMYPIMYLLYLFQQPKEIDDGGDIQLKLTIVASLDILYPRRNLFSNWRKKLKKPLGDYMQDYYRGNHPTAVIWKEGK